MPIKSFKVTPEHYRQAVAEALDKAELRFNITEGMIVHIEKEERKARQRRLARQQCGSSNRR